MQTPYDFAPTRIEDFCGPARRTGVLLQGLVTRRRPNSILALLKGEPGTGKSALARHFCRQLSSPFHLSELNGTDVSIDRLRDLQESIHYTTGHEYRCILVDEADAIPPAAQVKLLSFLDLAKTKRQVAIVFTSNHDFDKFPERLQSRFQVFEVDGPTYPEIKQFLLDRWPDAGEATIDQIARLSCGIQPGSKLTPETLAQRPGNLRAALLDLDTALLAQHQLAA